MTIVHIEGIAEYQMFGDADPLTWLHDRLSLAVSRGWLDDFHIRKMEFDRGVTCVYTFSFVVTKNVFGKPMSHDDYQNGMLHILNQTVHDSDVELTWFNTSWDTTLYEWPSGDPIPALPTTSAEFGEKFMVRVVYQDKGRTFHGPFDTHAQAEKFAELQEDDYKDVKHAMVMPLNSVHPGWSQV